MILKLVIFIIGFASAPLFSQDMDLVIRQLNNQMEDHFRNGRLRELSLMYLDNAVMLAPGGVVVEGRSAIDAYWLRIKDPVDWKLDVILVTKDESEIMNHTYWQALTQKPPDWHSFFENTSNDDIIFQLGHSTLITNWEGNERSSEVDFLLVWKKEGDTYRILADTYTW